MEYVEIIKLTHSILENELLFNGLLDYDIKVWFSIEGFNNVINVRLSKNELIHYETAYKLSMALVNALDTKKYLIDKVNETITQNSKIVATELITMIRSD